MKLSVQLVVWNGEKFLPALFESLKKQTFNNWELLIWDNGSTDRSKEIIDSTIDSLGVNVKKHYHELNIGFAPAHNYLFNLSDSEYIFTLNQDTKFDSDLLGKLIEYLDHNQKVASVAPVILRLTDSKTTQIVDSLGLEFKKTRQVVDIGAGSEYSSFDPGITSSFQVFGVTAAAAVYLRAAVNKVCRSGELFDPAYVSYQEDIDLAWKLRLGGYDSVVLADAVIYHERSVREAGRGFFKNIQKKKEQPFFVRKQSYKNHLATIIKNEQWQNFILDFIFIFWYEVVKLVYILIFDRPVLLSFKELWQERRNLLSERERIKSISRENWREIGRWFA